MTCTIFFFLDFDGTLTPIVETPQKAVLSDYARQTLRILVRRPGCKVAVISGRKLDDVRKRVRLKGVIYVGSHGAEIKGPGFARTVVPPRAARVMLAEILKKLAAEFSGTDGVLIEDKKLAVAFHYRLVAPHMAAQVKRRFHQIVRPYTRAARANVLPGKEVYEIGLPGMADKGKAVLALLAKYAGRARTMPVYIGDDTTDESAFRALGTRGITIKVGKKGPSHARYFLKDINEVLSFLRATPEIAK